MKEKRYQVLPRVLCIIFSEDKRELVLMKASNQKDWSGIYNPPGGHIEADESVIEAAEKEIGEETGLTPHGTKVVGIINENDFFGKDVMLFITQSTAEKKKLKKHREGIPEWVKIDSLDNYEVMEDLLPILNKLQDLEHGQLIVGKCKWNGKDKLVDLDIDIF